MACLLAEPHGRSFRIRDVIASGEVMHCMDLVETADAADDRGLAAATTAVASGNDDDSSPIDHLSQWDLAIVNALHGLIDRWMKDRCALQMSVATGVGSSVDVGPLLDCFSVGAVALHGVKDVFSGSATFFLVGASADAALDSNALEVLELLMPSLHIARQRIYRTDRSLGQHRSMVGLTAREIKVLAMIADGKTDEETARTTGRSVHTIKNQVRHLITKLGAKNRTQAVLIAARHDLLDAGD